jgi:unsaturated rhamnogalacturonyl hydrolase
MKRATLLLISTLVVVAFLVGCAPVVLGGTAAGESVGWDTATEILARIRAPTFPARDFVITDFGAVPGGAQDSTDAIRRAIQACHDAGGGRVVVPKGLFLTGAIHLKSNVNLHLERDATLQFKSDPAAYLPVVFTRWEGIECMNYSAFIYAFEQENVAVTGEGTLDGGASEGNWWAWARRSPDRRSPAREDVATLNEMSERGVPAEKRIFGAGHNLRPNFIQPYRCKNVLIEGVTIIRSPMWEVHPVLCTNVIVRNLTITTRGPNNDGCDPESCRDVLIEGCLFDTGDDCIAIKSGRNEDGRRVGVPSENLVVRGCTMKDGHAGVAIGSEISGGCRNVFIQDCRMDSPNLERALRLKSNARRGGILENIFLRNVEIGRVAEALLTIDFLYEEGPRGDFPPVARNIVIENVTSRSCPRLFFIQGFEGATIDRIRVANSTFMGVEAAEVVEHAGRIELENVTIVPAALARSRSSRQTPN